ncbi:interferon-related developmental regulator 2 isoform X1 [Gopherus evgoodei]|uniref:interferon-related developmental regulator 2 isoform X1 n=1 Tax=Gopherus evgoodei TaxID=1825980 RepID=UPI0011D015DF|nr:interferon-related developmental regulator 2 isoform X1 [Gopherus evgoodei]
MWRPHSVLGGMAFCRHAARSLPGRVGSLSWMTRARSSAKAESQASDDEAASEVLSHYSSASESTSIAEEGAGSDAVDEQAQQEEVEDKLKECIDNVTDKSTRTRQVALESLRLAFSSKTLFDFLLERRLTLTDSLEKCLKKGKGEEQSLAASVLTLLCLQMGSGPEGEEVFRSLKPLLISILTDSSASPIARQSCATALGMCCYIAAADVEDLVSCLTSLEGIFGTSCPEEGSSVPTHHSPLLQTLHCSALQSWSLLLTICPSSQIKKILDKSSSSVRTQTCCAASSKPWPLTATSIGPRRTDASSARSSAMCCTSSRMVSAMRRPSSLAWSACTWTAGSGEECTTPSKRCWAPGSGITCRTTSCCVRSLTWGLLWCWTLQLSKPVRSPASRSTCTTRPPSKPGRKPGAVCAISEPMSCDGGRSLRRLLDNQRTADPDHCDTGEELGDGALSPPSSLAPAVPSPPARGAFRHVQTCI